MAAAIAAEAYPGAGNMGRKFLNPTQAVYDPSPARQAIMKPRISNDETEIEAESVTPSLLGRRYRGLQLQTTFVPPPPGVPPDVLPPVTCSTRQFFGTV
jgi:hypothetical protein